MSNNQPPEGLWLSVNEKVEKLWNWLENLDGGGCFVAVIGLIIIISAWLWCEGWNWES